MYCSKSLWPRLSLVEKRAEEPVQSRLVRALCPYPISHAVKALPSLPEVYRKGQEPLLSCLSVPGTDVQRLLRAGVAPQHKLWGPSPMGRHLVKKPQHKHRRRSQPSATQKAMVERSRLHQEKELNAHLSRPLLVRQLGQLLTPHKTPQVRKLTCGGNGRHPGNGTWWLRPEAGKPWEAGRSHRGWRRLWAESRAIPRKLVSPPCCAASLLLPAFGAAGWRAAAQVSGGRGLGLLSPHPAAIGRTEGTSPGVAEPAVHASGGSGLVPAPAFPDPGSWGRRGRNLAVLTSLTLAALGTVPKGCMGRGSALSRPGQRLLSQARAVGLANWRRVLSFSCGSLPGQFYLQPPTFQMLSHYLLTRCAGQRNVSSGKGVWALPLREREGMERWRCACQYYLVPRGVPEDALCLQSPISSIVSLC